MSILGTLIDTLYQFTFQFETPKIRDIAALCRDTRDSVQNPGLSREDVISLVQWPI